VLLKTVHAEGDVEERLPGCEVAGVEVQHLRDGCGCGRPGPARGRPWAAAAGR
jgi:hypothetical protein